MPSISELQIQWLYPDQYYDILLSHKCLTLLTITCNSEVMWHRSRVPRDEVYQSRNNLALASPYILYN
jgi:hypothetical protein